MVLIEYFAENGSLYCPPSRKVTFEEYRQIVKAIGHSEGKTWRAYFC
jgi:hypothetical protein